MADLEKLTHKQLIDKIWQVTRDWQYCGDEYEPLKNELLRRLGSAGQGEPE